MPYAANPALNSILDRPSFPGSFVRSTGGPNSVSNNAEFGVNLDAPGFEFSGRVSALLLATIVVGLVAFNWTTRNVQL